MSFTPNLNLETIDEGLHNWHTAVTSNFEKIDKAFPGGIGGPVSTVIPTAIDALTFRAFLGSSQSIGTVTVKIELDTESYDDGATFDNVTNFRFTPNVSGLYHLIGMVGVVTFTGFAVASIFKNGSQVAAGTKARSEGHDNQSHVSDVVFANGTTDFFELFGVVSLAGQSLIVGTASTYFAGRLIARK